MSYQRHFSFIAYTGFIQGHGKPGKSWNVIICLVDWLMHMSQQGQFKIEMNN